MSLEGCKLRFWQVFDCFWTDVPGSKAVGPARSGPVAAKGPGADWHYITGRLKGSLGQIRDQLDSFRNLVYGVGVL
jgi:hypothetical protein